MIIREGEIAAMSKKIPLFSLVLLIVAAIDSIRNLPAVALFGSSLIFFFLFSAVIFLVPISLISAELASRFPEEGGVFHWIRHAFGKRMAVLAVWLQWINTMVWYPSMLSFIAGTAAYLYDPALAQSKLFLCTVILVIFWTLTLVNLRGIRVSAKINSVCGTIGTLLPMTFLIVLAGYWFFSGKPLAISFGMHDLLPHLGAGESWISLVAIMASFLGMELAGVHVTDIEEPRKNFPKAMGLSVLILLTTMILGCLSIAIIIPDQKIRLVDGIMQTFSAFFAAFHLTPFLPLLTLLIIFGSVGGIINWLVSPAKGLLQAAEYGFLPPFFSVKNRHGVPTRLLIGQAVVVSLICLLFILLPNINSFYWFLTALSTELYMIMYILLFLAALKLCRPTSNQGVYSIPKGLRTLSCVLGLFACLLTIVVSYFPPTEIQMGIGYFIIFIVGTVASIAPVGLLWMYEKKRVGKR